MRLTITFGAAALALAFALPAAAQSTATDPAAAPPSPPSSASTAPGAAASSSTSSSSAAVTVGQPVKDNTGATIGKVASVKPDASGKTLATIQMGADTFAVDTSALAVDNGAAVINASQEEIKGMMKK